MMHLFVKFWSLDKGPEGDAAAAMAIEDPDAFVLKPQREGGGNNLYGADLKQALQRMSGAERAAFILMERIFTPPRTNTFVNMRFRTGASGPVWKVDDVVSELGIYGVILSVGTTVAHNQHVGHLLRSKSAKNDDGGVAAGVALLDSPHLMP